MFDFSFESTFEVKSEKSYKKRKAAEATGLILQFAKFDAIVELVCSNEISNIVNCQSINFIRYKYRLAYYLPMLIEATKRVYCHEEKKIGIILLWKYVI